MKKMILSAMAVMALGFTSLAQAGEQGGYAGGGLGVYNLSAKGTDLSSAKSFGGYVSAGYDTGMNVSGELRLSKTQRKDVSSVPGTKVDLGMDYGISYLVKPYYEVSDINLYALAGVTTAKFTSTSGGVTGNLRKTAFSYGVGAESSVAENCTVGVEWFRPMTDINTGSGTKLTVDAFTVNGTYKF